MKISLVTVGEPLPEMDSGRPRMLRTGALAEYLASRGHDVEWWTSTFDHYGKKHRSKRDFTYDWNGVTIRMLRSVGYRRNLSPFRFIEHAHLAKKFATQVRMNPTPDVVLASLPTTELAVESVRFGAEFGVPVLVDVRDLWPDAIIELAPGALRWMARGVFSWMNRHANEALSGATGIIGISDAYLKWGLRRAGRPRRAFDGMFPLGYMAPETSAEGGRAAHQKLRELGVSESKVICWYVGSFGRTYDLEPMLEAARYAHAEFGSTVQFVISGDGELGTHWRRCAAGLPNVVFTGWIGADEINWLRDHAAVGFQPYAANAPQGLANKLFEYLSAGVPVLSSLQGECRDLLSQFDCGLTYQPGSGTSCFQELRKLILQPEIRRQMGTKGRELFLQRFAPTTLLEGLARHLESFRPNAGPRIDVPAEAAQ